MNEEQENMMLRDKYPNFRFLLYDYTEQIRRGAAHRAVEKEMKENTRK